MMNGLKWVEHSIFLSTLLSFVTANESPIGPKLLPVAQSPTLKTPEFNNLLVSNFVQQSIITIDLTKNSDCSKSFSLGKSTWFDVRLPSLQVDLVLMFNSSAHNVQPIFNVGGTFCTNRTSENLFTGLKGPESKMISRKDLLSLKARTTCDNQTSDENTNSSARLFLNAIPTKISTSDDAMGSLYVFLLNNQTKSSEKKNQTKKEDSQNTTIPTIFDLNSTSLLPMKSIDKKRSKRSVYSLSQIPVGRLFNITVQIPDNSLILSVHDNSNTRANCSSQLAFKKIGCNETTRQMDDGQIEVSAQELNSLCPKELIPTSLLQISGLLMCSNQTTASLVQLVANEKERSAWYQSQILKIWIPIGVGVGLLIWICVCYISIWRIRRSRCAHSFQRNAALQRTTSDPRPRRVDRGTNIDDKDDVFAPNPWNI
ncbi:hypothetical protein M3Y95_00162900 [Aphelenchoides besseyi]|nr:hypothetical protein M3Y95_00162900 [Aphelenchoides besseyi]